MIKYGCKSNLTFTDSINRKFRVDGSDIIVTSIAIYYKGPFNITIHGEWFASGQLQTGYFEPSRLALIQSE